MEYSPGGEMFYHLQNYRFTDEEARAYICEVICALEELHQHKVLYRDLKVLALQNSPKIFWSIYVDTSNWQTLVSPN